MITASIIGASGYTGVELLRILLNHPRVKIKSLIAESNAGKELRETYPHLAPYNLPKLISLDEENFEGVDVVFCGLPHATTQQVVLKLPKHVKIIDISADFRIENADSYEKWYGHKHIAPELQKGAVYGLSEIYREQIKKADLIACPGCYPTSILLPTLPLIKAGLIESSRIIADSKSGISGAGRKAATANLFTEVNESVRPYSIGGHRHVAEIEQELAKVANDDVVITFTPQVVPTNRGILSCIYVDLKPGKNAADLKSELEKFYKNEAFVKIAEGKYHPTTRDVFGTNLALINVFEDRVKGRAIIISAIDNLTKGASGQAVQNMNIRFGFPETEGLNLIPMMP
jgi:N-acetyl-gamma-glutamyl-phosphate reductase